MKKRIIGMSAMGVVCLMTAVGCGQAGANGKAISTTSQSASGPHVGGSISISPQESGPWADVFNPYSPNGNTSDISKVIYEPLVEWDSNTGMSKAWLAKSWTWSDGNKVLTVHLRPGVKWSNGKKFTSADVVFTYNMLKKYPALDSNGLWSFMKSISAKGPDTVQVVLKQPNSTFFYYFSGVPIVSTFQFQGVNPLTFQDQQPIGTGPYMLQTFNSQQITLTRNPHYWQPGKPYLQTVNYPAETSNDSTILGLESGQIQWASIFSPSLETSYVKKDPTANHFNDGQAPAFDSLYVNLHSYPLNMPEVRQAISVALDRSKLSKIGESGYASPVSSLDGIPDSLASQWGTTSLNKMFPATYNTSKAKNMLLKAGFKMSGSKMMTPQGKPFTINMIVPAPFTDYVTLSNQIASMLGQIGITVNQQSISSSQYADDMAKGNFQMGVYWTPTGPNPFFVLNGLMNTQYGGPIGSTALGSNYGRFANDQVQKLAQQFEGTENASTQKTIIDEMATIYAEQLPVIPLLNSDTTDEYSSKTIGGWPTKQNPYWDTNSYGGPVVVLTQLYQK
ncbi:ABC transporter substrate-binding protein [Alicyclobacillus fodiniaquatilis]|uniref:ABC transporter substrate-binding protein n=1 Tax=Alicyclobacillus fodiniaquatilis TaxID=1661150 RepID=A0ABW4JDE3_9BACL